MKLLIDIGNTRLKSALLHQGELIQHRSMNWRGHDLDIRLTKMWADLQPVAVGISSVAPGEVVERVKAFSLRTWRLEPQLAQVRTELFGLRCGYHQPESLGVDRWLAMLGAWGRQQGRCWWQIWVQQPHSMSSTNRVNI